jgi:hypothetical protein
MRFPSKGIGFVSGCKRGSAMTFFMPSSRTLREGQVIQEKTTVSSSLRLTAMGNDVTLPSGSRFPHTETKCYLRNAAMPRSSGRSLHIRRWKPDWLAGAGAATLSKLEVIFQNDRSI